MKFKLSNIFFSILFAFLVLLILSFGINSDFDNYTLSFASMKNNEIDLLSSIRSNTLVNYFWYHLTNLFGVFNPSIKALLLFFFQAFLHSFLIFNLAGLKIGSILLFTDLQQIDLNQVRFGLALCLITIVSRNFLIKRKFKSILGKYLFNIRNFSAILFGFLLHFQSIQLLFFSYLSKLKLRNLIVFSTLIITLFPLFLKTTGITSRYINIPVSEENLPLNLFLYIPTILLSLLWISGEEGGKILYFNFERINIFKLEKKIFAKYFIPLVIFCTGFFLISKSPAYQGRIITGFYSTLIFLIAIKKSLKNTKLPLHLIFLFLIVGFYRTLTLSGNIYRFI